MFLLYTLLIRIYTFLIVLASLFNSKAGLWIKGRKNQLDKIRPSLEEWKNQHVAWIHAASYGEFEMSKPLIKELQEEFPQMKFIVSFYSPSGYENVHLKDDSFIKIYLEKDLIKLHEAYIKEIKPDFVVFIKYEFWFNFLRVLKQENIPYYFTSLHMNRDHYLFNPIMKPLLNLLKSSKKIFCHNQTSHNILTGKGFTNVSVLGDTRIKQAQLNLKNKRSIPWTNPDRQTIIFGSATLSESDIICEFVNSHNSFNIIIAPHDIDNHCISVFTDKINRNISMFSGFQHKVTSDVLMVDTLGDLKYLYGNADVAYIGAGFEKGPHNILEPLVFGIPVITGPNIWKFPMASLLKSKGLLYILDKKNNLGPAVDKILKSDTEKFSHLCSTFFKENQANLDIFTKEIKQLIGD